jgi:Zn-dependent protease/predicted transcriptional regulator
MTKGVKIGRILGVEIILDYSWFLISALIAWSFGNLFREAVPGLALGRGGYFGMGVLAAVLFFAGLLAHEMGHALVARGKGIEVSSITLFVFGGVAHIRRDPAKPGDEFKIAIAGPVVSVVLGLLLLGVAWVASRAGADPAAAIFAVVGQISLVLAVFNLAPGFPLDGGRVLRAVVWKATGDVVRATRVASIAGRVIAWGLIAIGVYRILDDNLTGGLWLILIGWFLFQAAVTGYQQTLLRQSLRGLTVADLMTREVVTIPGNTRIDDAVNEYFLRHRHTAYPVTGYGDEVEGLLGLQQIRESPRDRWMELTARQVMQPVGPEITARPGEPVEVILERMEQNPLGRFLVLEGGTLSGLLSASDIARHLRIKAWAAGESSGIRSSV